MKQIWKYFLCFILIKFAYSENNECLKSRKWQIGYTMYENSWFGGRLYVYTRCNISSHFLSGGNWKPCVNGQLKNGLSRCLPKKEELFFNCEVGNSWQDGITKYEVVRHGKGLYVSAKCNKEDFIIDRDTSFIPCENSISNLYLPQCRKGEVKNLFEACATGRRSRIEDYEFENVWHHGVLYVRAFCLNEGAESRSDTIICENGKMKRSPSKNFCVMGKSHEDTCLVGKKWNANDTDYEIFRYGNDFMVTSRCKKGFHISDKWWKLCENERIPSELPQCKVAVLLPTTVSSITKEEVRLTNRNSTQTPKQSAHSSSRIKCSLANGGCNHICKSEKGTVQCSCHKGYQLHRDNKTCFDINECLSENFGCSDECVNTPGSAYCSCPDGFTLQRDRKHCTDIDECANHVTNKCHHQCINTNGSYRCSCDPGYVLINDMCEDIDECVNDATNKCRHQCVNTQGSYKCSCHPGYVLINDFNCKDIDECAKNTTNKCNHQCVNTKGSYKCSCRPGHVLINDFKCEGCRKNSYRSSSDALCVDCPFNSHTEVESRSSVADCLCNSGFYGNISNDETCRDIDECESSNFGCSDSCINTIGSAFCSCPLGFQLQKDQKTCRDIDECHVKNGGCQGICHNSNGSFRCTCEEGYTVSTTDSYACDDINECLENNGGCSKECVNFLGGYQCSCPEDSFLAEDEKTCLTLYCPEVPIPYYSRLSCFPKANKNAETVYYSKNATYSEKLPVGTVCRVKCNKGYAIGESSSVISCQKNGIWNDTLEECEVAQCPSLKPPENGDVHPPECKEGLMTVNEKCYFTCKEGYSIKGSKTVFTCKNNLKWKYDNIPTCKPIYIPPYITCPSDLELDLLPDNNSSVIFLKYPKTNVGDVQVTPHWVKFERNVSFPAGETDILLVANNPHFKNVTANCTFSVTVLDSQSPEFLDCPEVISAIGSSVGGAVVDWEEPTAFDNVGIKSVTKNAEPNSTWFPGLHIVEYIAEDFAGNIVRCSFEINVTSSECEDLKNPENGDANCQDWGYGKVCEPTCHTNYTRGYNEDDHYYFCDGNGVWTPSDVISPCLPECESEKIWSPELENCVDIIENTTDAFSL